ncbi:MAG: hypothetical protein JO256_00085 [Alphaproteobacteria bacterium]|nr:hypothetical protein [Alphaproteobacteria bacterium]
MFLLAGVMAAGAVLAQDDPAGGFRGLFIHDECMGENVEQPDTCLHAHTHEKSFTFGGRPGVVYDVTLRVRGLFEPTRIEGGKAPDAANPWFVVGGEDKSTDYSQWHIDVSSPAASYTLNNYPRVSHTIYKEDFQVTIPVAAGAKVLIQTVDSNDREIDNGAKGRSDRQQILDDVASKPPNGQVLRMDVLAVKAR